MKHEAIIPYHTQTQTTYICAGVLKNVGAKLIACVRAAGGHGLQVKWLRRLLEAGKYADIAKTETLRILYLGKEADGILRTLRSCSELLEIEVAELAMEEKESLRTALKIYVQVKIANRADVDAAGKQEALTKLEALKNQLTATFDSLAAKYDETRQERASWANEHMSITTRLAEMDPTVFSEGAAHAVDNAFAEEVRKTTECKNLRPVGFGVPPIKKIDQEFTGWLIVNLTIFDVS